MKKATCTLISNLPRNSRGQVYYRGRWWTPNKPTNSWRAGKKRAVLAVKDGCAKLIHYGAAGYRHNYSADARRRYLQRSAGIVDAAGRKTATDKHSANYWARVDLWKAKK